MRRSVLCLPFLALTIGLSVMAQQPAGVGLSLIVKISEEYVLLQVVSEAEAHYYLGYALAGQGKLDEAVDEFLIALRIAPEYAETHTSLGNALALQGKLDEAIAEHRAALRINPQYAEAHNYLGNALHEQGNLDEAIDEHRAALRINPQY